MRKRKKANQILMIEVVSEKTLTQEDLVKLKEEIFTVSGKTLKIENNWKEDNEDMNNNLHNFPIN